MTVTSTNVVELKRTEKGLESVALKGMNISDVHLLNTKIPSKSILEGLYAIFDKDENLQDLDYICFVGDLFDTLVYWNHPELIDVLTAMAYILRRAKQFDITVYFLLGTPRHDWEQILNLVALNGEIGQIGARVFYFDKITVFYDEKFDMHMLFVPDEMNHDTAVTLAEVKELMEAKRIEQVDIGFMHGQFPYQLPAAVRAPTHDPEEYQRICKHGVFIGHVHKHSMLDKIYVQGSFDRDTHGQEEEKGYLIHEIFTNGTHRVTFKVNPHALVFKTIDCRGMTIDETFEKIDIFAKAHGPETRLRVHGDSGNPIFSQMRELSAKYPWIIWSKKEESAAKKVVEQIVNRELAYEPVYINKGNVQTLMSPRLDKAIDDEVILRAAHTILEEVIGVGAS